MTLEASERADVKAISAQSFLQGKIVQSRLVSECQHGCLTVTRIVGYRVVWQGIDELGPVDVKALAKRCSRFAHHNIKIDCLRKTCNIA